MAVNNNEWKLVVKRGAPDTSNIKEIDQLFHISEDPFEKADLSAQNPRQVKKLMKKLNRFYNLKSVSQIPRFADKKNLSEPEKIPKWQPVR